MNWLARILFAVLVRRVARRAADLCVGGVADPYLRRWYLCPWSRFDRSRAPRGFLEQLQRRLPALYVHQFLRDDDDRALHDHPWWSVSLTLRGAYCEVLPIDQEQPCSLDFSSELFPARLRVVTRKPGALTFRSASMRHRIMVGSSSGAWTLFLTGPRLRDWGFWCRHGFVPWQRFTDPKTAGTTTGAGCDA